MKYYYFTTKAKANAVASDEGVKVYHQPSGTVSKKLVSSPVRIKSLKDSEMTDAEVKTKIHEWTLTLDWDTSSGS